jgi:Uma2 family endonuclease
MALGIRAPATLDDLRRVDGKAEWIAGTIVRLMPTGFRPGLVGGRIYQSLAHHCAATGRGVALPDNVGFVVPELRSGRRSFSPDAAYYLGPLPPDDMDFLEGPPTFAVEVRSKGDIDAAAESAMAAKRADYFEAGTLVVWDVDLRAEVLRSYRRDSADPLVFTAGDIADAEPAVLGWRVEVSALLGVNHGP